MKLLVIEDDQRTAELLHRGLTQAGFVVDVCANGLDGAEQAVTGHYGLIILDVMLPGLDGWGVLDAIRAKGVGAAILMLTAREAVDDRVKGLNGGADDYVCKPFAFSELLARIRTLLRRVMHEQPSEMEFEGVRVDARRHRVTRNDVQLDLTAKEFQLLDLLMQHRGEVLSKVFISEHLWDMNFDGDSNVLEVHIGRLRAKIDAPFERKIVHTVRGRGYVVR